MSQVINNNKHIVETLTNGFKPDVRVYKEAIYLVNKGYKVTILCWDREVEDKLPQYEVIDGIEVIRYRHICPAGIKKNKYKKFFYYIMSCRDYMQKNQCDYVHCNDISGAIVGLFSKRSYTPMVVDMHEYFETGSLFKRFLMHYLLLFVFKKSLAGLYENAAYISDSYSSIRDKLYPLRNYPDAGMVEYREKSKSSVLRVGFHGWIRKNMFDLKSLFEAVVEMEGIRVDINGGGPGLLQIKEWAKNNDKVFIHGPFDGTKMMSILYENTDITFCGYDKNDPNYQGDAEVVKYYESIRTATPIIMTKGIGMGDKVEKYGFGVSCDTRNKEEIKQALLRFRDDKTFFEMCRKNELKESPKYIWENAVRILDHIYDDKV